MSRRVISMLLLVGLMSPAALLAKQNLVKNGSMESGDGAGAIDPQIAADWVEFGTNVERSGAVNLAPAGGGYSLKAFGDTDNSSGGVFQEVAGVAPGQSVTVSVQLYSPSNDKLIGSGQAGIVLEFVNLFGGTITLHEVYPFTAASPGDTWVPASIGPLTAPSGTVDIRVSCRLEWTPGDIGGAVYWDDAQVSIDGGANALLNGDFEVAGPSPGQSPAGIDDWNGFEDQEKSSDVAEHGVASLKLGTSAAYSGLYQSLGDLFDGDHIYAIAYVWNPSSDPLSDNSRVGIKLEFDAGTAVPPPEGNLAFDETAIADTWTLIDISTIVPADVTIARITMIYGGDSTTTGSVHFDAAYAERGGAPGVNQLSNESFENGPGGDNGLTDWFEFQTSGVSSCQKDCFGLPTYQEGICSALAFGEAYAGIWQEIAVTPGETLDIGAYLYTPNTDQLTGTGIAGVKVEWSFGGVPDDIDIGGATNTIDASAPTDTWIPIYIDYVMPAGTSAVGRFVNLIERGTALSGTVYFDSCEAVLLNVYDGADVDGDADEDMIDFAWLQRTYTDAGGGPLPFNGIVFDSDEDDDIDITDWNYFWPRITGPAN